MPSDTDFRRVDLIRWYLRKCDFVAFHHFVEVGAVKCTSTAMAALCACEKKTTISRQSLGNDVVFPFSSRPVPCKNVVASHSVDSEAARACIEEIVWRDDRKAKEAKLKYNSPGNERKTFMVMKKPTTDSKTYFISITTGNGNRNSGWCCRWRRAMTTAG